MFFLMVESDFILSCQCSEYKVKPNQRDLIQSFLLCRSVVTSDSKLQQSPVSAIPYSTSFYLVFTYGGLTINLSICHPSLTLGSLLSTDFSAVLPTLSMKRGAQVAQVGEEVSQKLLEIILLLPRGTCSVLNNIRVFVEVRLLMTAGGGCL